MQEKQVYEGFMILSDQTAFKGLIDPETVEEIEVLGWANSGGVNLIETDEYKVPKGIHEGTLYITDILLPIELVVDRPTFLNN